MSALALVFVRRGDELHVLASPSGDMQSLRPVGWFSPDWAGVEAATLEMREHVRLAAASGEMSVTAQRSLRALGAFLFDELFPLTAKRWIRDTQPASVVLSLSPSLLDVPWELAHTGSDFLGIQHAIGRIVHFDHESVIRLRPLPTERLRTLIVADPDGALVEAYHEGMLLNDRLSHDPRIDVTLRTTDVDALTLRRTLRDFDVVHFAGHIDEGGWRMSESRFDAAALERIAGSAALPSLVFANGCGGASGAQGEMLQRWFEAGVRHFVAPLFDLPDRLGRSFAVLFYDGLLAGASVGEAMLRARRQLADDHGEGTTPWGAYVLYGDPRDHYAAAPRRSATPTREERPTRLSPYAVPEREALRGTGTHTLTGVSTPRRRQVAEVAFWSVVITLAGLAALVAYLSRPPI